MRVSVHTIKKENTTYAFTTNSSTIQFHWLKDNQLYFFIVFRSITRNCNENKLKNYKKKNEAFSVLCLFKTR